jgi:RNA polymerase sigma-B factor
MSTATHAVAGVPSVSSTARRRKEPAALAVWPQARWQPPSRGTATSTSDEEVLDAGLAHPDALLIRLGELARGDAGRVAVRAQVIEWYLPMAMYLARRFSGRGEPLADLTQVAAIGLIKAVDRYDADRGVAFAGYAIPTIAGEIKRYFRDAAWTVRVPRRLQELKPQLATVTEDLAQVLRRSPTTVELAARLGVSHGDVLAAQRCVNAYRPLSLERPAPGSEDLRLIGSLGGPDPGIEAVDSRETLRVVLVGLPARERRIIALRYFADMSQDQIGAEIGVSQMQVSRLLAQILTRLRDGMLAAPDSAAVEAGPAGVMPQVPYADPSSGGR